MRKLLRLWLILTIVLFAVGCNDDKITSSKLISSEDLLFENAKIRVNDNFRDAVLTSWKFVNNDMILATEKITHIDYRTGAETNYSVEHFLDRSNIMFFRNMNDVEIDISEDSEEKIQPITMAQWETFIEVNNEIYLVNYDSRGVFNLMSYLSVQNGELYCRSNLSALTETAYGMLNAMLNESYKIDTNGNPNIKGTILITDEDIFRSDNLKTESVHFGLSVTAEKVTHYLSVRNSNEILLVGENTITASKPEDIFVQEFINISKWGEHLGYVIEPYFHEEYGKWVIRIN